MLQLSFVRFILPLNDFSCPDFGTGCRISNNRVNTMKKIHVFHTKYAAWPPESMPSLSRRAQLYDEVRETQPASFKLIHGNCNLHYCARVYCAHAISFLSKQYNYIKPSNPELFDAFLNLLALGLVNRMLLRNEDTASIRYE
jgi:hypothetical protein